MPQFIGSVTPITAGQTFTSKWVNTNIFTAITGTVFTDQAGNLFIDQSGDGINADASTTVAVTASTGTTFNVTIVAPFLRIRFTNTAGSNQTALRLHPRFVLGNMP